MWNSHLRTVLFLEFLLIGQQHVVDAGKVVGFLPYPCKSHSVLGSSLLKELARRGHEVTMISSYPLTENVENYRDIFLNISTNVELRQKTIVNVNQFPLLKAYSTLDGISRLSANLFSDENVKSLVASGEKFDLAINFGMPALVGLGHALNASTVTFCMLSMSFIHGASIMNPLPSAYVPNLVLPYSDEMRILERIVNSILNLLIDFYMEYFWLPNENEIIQKHFPGSAHLRELYHNVPLTLHNSHMAIDNTRPHMSNVIPIGGFHLQDVEEMSQDLKSFLDNASDGVILFSLGTGLGSEVMRDKLNATLKCFATLPYQILWKHDKDDDGLPKNVKTMKWIPQRAVLNHTNVKLFITHGGHGSILESVFHSVPMIILPFCVDQHNNADQGARNGYAIHLDVDTLTEEKLCLAINEMITNSAYLDEITLRSDVIRYQEINPMERAIYWIEWAMEHRKSKYVNCAASELSLYEYYLLDVFSGLLTLLVTFICIFWNTCKK